MKEVRSLVTTQIRLFAPDLIPLSKVAVPEYTQQIQSLFEFAAIGPVQGEGNLLTGIKFEGGLLKFEGEKPDSVVIETVTIEQRRIIVKVQGSSLKAQFIFEVVRQKLEEMSGKTGSIKEALCTHETGTSVVLDFRFDELLSTGLNSFLSGPALNATKNPWSENLIVPWQLWFSVRYKITDDALAKSSFSLANKPLKIEPRVHSSVDEKLYWIESPTDTDTHFKLIEQLERELTKTR